MSGKTIVWLTIVLSLLGLMAVGYWVVDNILFELLMERDNYAWRVESLERENQGLRNAIAQAPEMMGARLGCRQGVDWFLSAVGTTAAAIGQLELWAITWVLEVVCEWLGTLRYR